MGNHLEYFEETFASTTNLTFRPICGNGIILRDYRQAKISLFAKENRV